MDAIIRTRVIIIGIIVIIQILMRINPSLTDRLIAIKILKIGTVRTIVKQNLKIIPVIALTLYVFAVMNMVITLESVMPG